MKKLLLIFFLFNLHLKANTQSDVKTVYVLPLGSSNYHFTHLCQTRKGMFYGIGAIQGKENSGILYAYNAKTNSITHKNKIGPLFSVESFQASLLLASNGKLYGISGSGGINKKGILFEYNPVNNTFLIKFNFDGKDNGSYPNGALIQASNGKLYGMTTGGGENNNGIIYEYDILSDTLMKKFNFNSSTTGASPYGSLLEVGQGKLYGMTKTGGKSGRSGVLFEYDISNNNYVVKVDFNTFTTGGNPYGTLIQASNGKLYGMTVFIGTIFEFDPLTNSFKIKVHLEEGKKGITPIGPLIEVSKNKLYGMTKTGGANNMGFLFEYNITKNEFLNKKDFDEDNKGITSSGSLMLTSKGRLYGITISGGKLKYEVVLFEYDYKKETYLEKTIIK